MTVTINSPEARRPASGIIPIDAIRGAALLDRVHELEAGDRSVFEIFRTITDLTPSIPGTGRTARQLALLTETQFDALEAATVPGPPVRHFLEIVDDFLMTNPTEVLADLEAAAALVIPADYLVYQIKFTTNVDYVTGGVYLLFGQHYQDILDLIP